MIKGILRFLTVFAILFSSMLFLTDNGKDLTTFAGKSVQENKNEVAKLENTLDSKQDDIALLQKQIDEAKANVANQSYAKHLIDKQIDEIREEITITKQLIEEYGIQTEAKRIEIDAIQSKIDNAIDLIAERLIVQHETGNSSMISFVLGSDDFADLLTRIEVANELFEYDQEIIDALLADLDILSSSKAELEGLLEKCKTAEVNLSTKETELVTRAEDATNYLNELKKNEEFLESTKSAKEKELQEIQNEIKRLEEEIKLQERIDYSGDGFRFPLPYDAWYVNTGGFGWRVWASGRQTDYHKGVDFAAARGTHILAVNSGVVTISRLSPSFGNYVVIDHGGGISSLYAHATVRHVKVGDKVNKGDLIAEVGSTGDSTGNHLHFAILKNGEYVDPMGYISEP